MHYNALGDGDRLLPLAITLLSQFLLEESPLEPGTDVTRGATRVNNQHSSRLSMQQPRIRGEPAVPAEVQIHTPGSASSPWLIELL